VQANKDNEDISKENKYFEITKSDHNKEINKELFSEDVNDVFKKECKGNFEEKNKNNIIKKDAI